ncbi:MAG: hypothetical protein OXN84_21530 [Albidovulum sp.]|nr:hypothetical protein [Albidovulum sp.]
MRKFRVAISDDFMTPAERLAFPSVDLSPLDCDPRIDWSFVPVENGKVPAESVEGADALILLAATFDASSFPRDGRLALIARFGVGYDNVDVEACDANNVALAITPSGVRRPVAVAIMTFVLALSGNLLIKDRLARGGPDGWKRRSDHMGRGLVGLTLGSIGVGNIGAELFRLAGPFGMNFIAHDPFASEEAARGLGVGLVELDDLFRRADFLCVNCPLTEETEGLVDAAKLSLMKPTAYLINTARGPIVDQRALTECLAEKRIAGAGLDVFKDEPSNADDPLFSFENVIATPHSLCWTDQCFAEIGAADIRAVKCVMEGRVPEGVVNESIVDNSAWIAKLNAFRSSFGSEK